MNNLLAAYLRARHRRRTDCLHLRDMDDRTLSDIGLTRRDIIVLTGGETPAALKSWF